MEQVNSRENHGWDLVIRPRKKFLDIRPKDLWHYRDLLLLLVRRDIITVYKQTLLGFFWFIIPPVLNALTYLVIFGIFARVDTGTSNNVLFYLAGVIAWGFLADCTNRTSGTFRTNASIFGKVYFPRLIVPISSVVSALFKFFVQLGFFLLVMAWYILAGEQVNIQWEYIWLIPIVLFLTGLTGLAFGITISALTTKYRDLSNIVPFALQLLMYITPVVYPYTFFPEKIRWIFDLNPVSPLIEIFRFVMIGSDRLDLFHLLYCAGFTLVVLFIGLILFNRTEQTFMDTV